MPSGVLSENYPELTEPIYQVLWVFTEVAGRLSEGKQEAYACAASTSEQLLALVVILSLSSVQSTFFALIYILCAPRLTTLISMGIETHRISLRSRYLNGSSARTRRLCAASKIDCCELLLAIDLATLRSAIRRLDGSSRLLLRGLGGSLLVLSSSWFDASGEHDGRLSPSVASNHSPSRYPREPFCAQNALFAFKKRSKTPIA